VSFSVPAEAYDRFMGRYSTRLAPGFARFAGVGAGERGQRVLDVGCGPGALTTELVRLLGPDAVTAVDPSEPFVEAARERNPEVRVERASAEHLPFTDGDFDAALAQLVVHFMTDPVGGIGEMGRVTRANGFVAACVWDHAGGRGPLGVFWDAVHALDPDAPDESHLPGAREGDLSRLFAEAGLHDVEETLLSVAVEHPTFEEWWEPFELGVGPAGGYTSGLDPERREALREKCRGLLEAPPFVVTAGAWAARGRRR
jgi:SAM-dependent methyltransferase